MQTSNPRTCALLLQASLCLAAALLCLNARAEAFTPQALIEQSGTGVQLDFMPRALKISLGQAMQKGMLRLDKKQIEAIHTAFDHAYAPAQLRQMMAERIPARITPEHGAQIMDFLGSPLGQRIVACEKKIAQPGIQAEIEENAAKILADASASSTRLALYASLNQAMDGTRLAVQTYIGSALAMNAAILAVTPDVPHKPTMEEIRKGLEAQKLAITASLTQSILSNSAYMYRDLSEEELNTYLRFALSPVGRSYMTGVGESLAEIMVERAFEAGRFFAPERPPI